MAEQWEGLIEKGVGGLYEVRMDDGTHRSCKARGIFRKDGIAPLAGDRVRVLPDDNPGTGTITEIRPRKNSLIRPRIANVDLLVIVSSMAEPVLNLFIVDKMTAVAVSKGMEPIIVFTKPDLLSPCASEEIYRQIGMKCLSIDPEKDDGLAQLREWMAGKLSAFTGNTGVGKSTLLSRLTNQALETGDVSRKLGRGRHTTRQVELFALPTGGYTADTPGFSTLDIERYERIQKDDLPFCFPEFAPYLNQCKFSTCTHRTERGCAVLQAVQAGVIPVSRHESYCKMFEEVKDLRDWME